LNKIIILAD